MDKPRFSMLLLEPGEIYFEDYSCTFNDEHSTKDGNARQGRLKLCSKSLVFEPRAWSKPLIKLYFKDSIEIGLLKTETNAIKLKVRQYAEMLEDNILAPYKFVYNENEFYIFFDFASVEECLSQMQQLQRASTLHAPEHNSMVATILHSRYMRMVFDPVMMDDFTEEILCEIPVEKISPLVRHQGKLAVTHTTLYFQPFSNVEGVSNDLYPNKTLNGGFRNSLNVKMVSIGEIGWRKCVVDLKLNIEVEAVSPKKNVQEKILAKGLELYSSEESSTPHIYLTFQCEVDRDSLYKILEESPNSKLENVHADEMTLQWQNRVVSNYDYLMYLNCLADRSKNDLTQYPVFPWVIADYTSETLDVTDAEVFRDLSKPMGALNPERLEKLKERYQEMSDPKFLFGSHYSAPGLVLFYLVRKYPQYMLCLQNGRFDHPDRMFNSVRDVYNNCLKNMSDFKELVPEFYDTDSRGDFLVNNYDIDFGERHDGTKVNDVHLPPWATSPEDFVHKLREALESEYVSRHLHLWIDLIFGYKQRGEEAVIANNVFHHVCYEGSVDLELIYDMNDRHALEVQIMEFGQVPKQLFTKPHVRRVTNSIQIPIKNESNITSNKLECLDTILLHKEAVLCAIRHNNVIVSVGKDGTLKVYDLLQKKQIRSVTLSSTPLSCCVVIDENIVAVGSWSDEIYIYDVEYGRVVESFRAHDDSVSCLIWLPKERWLVSGGSDGVTRVWGCVGQGQALRGLKAELDHDGNITALTHRRRRHELDIITATSDGEMFVWDFANKAILQRITVHSSPISGLCMLSDDRVVTTSDQGDMTVTDLSVTHSVFQKKLPEACHSICMDGRTLWIGGASGTLIPWDMVAVVPQPTQTAHHDTINWISLDANSSTLITASSDKSIKVWTIVTEC